MKIIICSANTNGHEDDSTRMPQSCLELMLLVEYIASGEISRQLQMCCDRCKMSHRSGNVINANVTAVPSTPMHTTAIDTKLAVGGKNII